MKKLLLLFLLFFTTDSVASGIASNSASAPCTNNTLETYSGNSNLSADWQPNEIQLRWYNNNTLMDVQSAANTCTYDDTLTVPSTAPSRTGYTFDGWTVRPEIDFATITLSNTSSMGESYAIDEPSSSNSYNHGDDINCMRTTGMGSRIFKDCADNNYRDLQLHEWKMIDGHYTTIYGTGKCSAKIGNNNDDTWNNASSNWRATYNELENASGEQLYCWCQLTGYKPSNSDTIYGPNKSLPWIFTRKTEVNCVTSCAMFCSAKFITYPTLRNLMLDKTQ